MCPGKCHGDQCGFILITCHCLALPRKNDRALKILPGHSRISAAFQKAEFFPGWVYGFLWLWVYLFVDPRVYAFLRNPISFNHLLLGFENVTPPKLHPPVIIHHWLLHKESPALMIGKIQRYRRKVHHKLRISDSSYLPLLCNKWALIKLAWFWNWIAIFRSQGLQKRLFCINYTFFDLVPCRESHQACSRPGDGTVK